MAIRTCTSHQTMVPTHKMRFDNSVVPRADLFWGALGFGHHKATKSTKMTFQNKTTDPITHKTYLYQAFH